MRARWVHKTSNRRECEREGEREITVSTSRVCERSVRWPDTIAMHTHIQPYFLSIDKQWHVAQSFADSIDLWRKRHKLNELSKHLCLSLSHSPSPF